MHTMYTYDIICDIHLTWSRCRRCWSHWPGPCRPHCSSLLILSPARWSVLLCDSPDALYLVLACPGLTAAVQASQLAHPDAPPASQPEAAGALAVGQWPQWQNNLNVIWAISTNRVSQSDNCQWMTASGASDCYWCVFCRGSSVSALNLKYYCAHFVTIHLHARAPANVCARDLKRRLDDLTPLQGI